MKTFIPIFFIHGAFLVSVFDIYFKTNVLTGLNVVDNIIPAESKRIVLFVCDGLPAEYLYDYSEERSIAPFLRSVIENNGSWGLSYTRVPTESRPGHIALIAGLYEDPSAVFKGWKENPVSFDSVFNQSGATFMWGCHDILHLFTKDSLTKNIYSYSYPSEMQDYSGGQGLASMLDNWVLTKFDEFLNEIKSNKTLHDIVYAPKVVFFFHLLGVDVAGHASKPKTNEYFRTIQYADSIVRELTLKVESMFQDQKTTYIFTSDHGMTDWGSHGAGSAIETLTPIVAWGAGIKHALSVGIDDPSKVAFNNKWLNALPHPTPDHWRLSHLRRHDMNQADIAVLMSVILGIPIPVNSVGILPMSLLNLTEKQVAMAYILNSKQLMEHLNGVENKFHSEITPLLSTCYNLNCNNKNTADYDKIEHAIQMQDYEFAVNLTDNLITEIVNGIKYYEFYFQNILLEHVLLCFMALMIVIIGKVLQYWNFVWLEKYKMRPKSLCICISVLFALFILGILLASIGEILPIRYIYYSSGLLMLTSWAIVENPWVFSIPAMIYNKGMLPIILLYIILIELLMISFFERKILTFIMLLFSAWPIIDPRMSSCTSVKQKRNWIFSCIALSIFPAIPIVGNKEFILIKLSTGLIWFYILNKLRKSRQNILGFMLNNAGTKIQLYSTPILLLNCYDIARRYSNEGRLTLLNQILSFAVLLIFLITMKFGAYNIYPKFINICYSAGMSFILFSMSYDALFPLILSINLMHWLFFESKLHREHYFSTSDFNNRLLFSHLSQSYMVDFRRSYFFMLYVFLSFFGIGNLASINSFDTNWTRGFTDTFSPFMMLVLIVLRTVLPLFIVSCAFRCIIIQINGNAKVLFMIVLLFCNLIAAQFLFMVKNEGSWLDIGTSLSRFIIMESLVLILLPLYYLAKLCTSNVKASLRVHMNLP